MRDIGDFWFCAEGEQDGLPMIIRGRKNLGEIAGAGSHPKLLWIVWEYEVNTPTGLPASELHAAMADFEDIFLPALEQELLCVFFCVIIHNGAKRWAAYTSDVRSTGERFNSVLADRQPFPVQLTAWDDPEWQEYWKLMDDVGMSSTP